MITDILKALSTEQLFVECADASDYITIDQEGNLALLEEAERRMKQGDLEIPKYELIRAALSISREDRAHVSISIAMQPTHAWHGYHRALKAAAGERRLKYLYHGTLRSRLISIARDGLIPAKRPKRWGQPGITEHASSGVFFERNWRRASNWVGAAAADENMRPVKGAIIRVPVGSLIVENDERSAESLVVRQGKISVESAQVRLYPFTALAEWMSLPEAIEKVRSIRRDQRRQSRQDEQL
jgi:hypothetical protein